MGGIYWLASYPKSGNTWLRTFLHNLRRDGDDPANINSPDDSLIASACSWIDDVLGFDIDDLTPEEVDRLRPEVYRWATNDGETQFHKIHDAYTLSTDGEPIVSRAGTLGAVYLVRNPLDVSESLANHFNCTLDRAIAFMGDETSVLTSRRGESNLQVRQRVLSWSGHVTSWIDAPGLHREVLRYEDMLARPIETFGRAAAFLGLPTETSRIEKSIRFSEFSELSRQETEQGFEERPAHTATFFQRGEAGAWRDHLSADQVARVIADHGPTMRRLGYIDSFGRPTAVPAAAYSP